MAKGMIIQCGGCGFSRFVNLEGDFNAREAELNSVIHEGWRHVYLWKGFICPKCRTNGTDKLYETFAGKPKPSGELATYIELRWDADQIVAALKEGGG